MQIQTELHNIRREFPLGPLLFLMAIFFLSFLSRVIVSPLLPVIEQDLDISHAASGSIFLFLSFGYFISLLGSGFLSSIIGHRTTIVLSSVSTGVVLFCMGSIETAVELKTGIFFIGLAGGIYLPSAIAVISSLTRKKHWGMAFAIHEVAPNLAFLMAPLVASGLLEFTSWQQVFQIPGFFCIAIGGLFLFLGSRVNPRGEKPLLAQCKPLFRLHSFWLMIVIFTLGVVATLGIYSLLPLYLVNIHGLTDYAANTLVGYSRISTLFTALLGGWLSDRFGPRATMIGVFLITGLITLFLGVVDSNWISVFVFVQPIAAVCFFPAGFALLSGLAPLELRNVVISLTVPIAVLLGGGLVPTAIGFMADSNMFSLGISMAGVLMIVGSALLWFVRS